MQPTPRDQGTHPGAQTKALSITAQVLMGRWFAAEHTALQNCGFHPWTFLFNYRLPGVASFCNLESHSLTLSLLTANSPANGGGLCSESRLTLSDHLLLSDVDIKQETNGALKFCDILEQQF